MAYPWRGQALPIELASTVFAEDGQLRDGLASLADLTDWLARNQLTATPPAPPTAERLARWRALRRAVGELLAAVVDGVDPSAEAVDLLNATCAAAPTVAALLWRDAVPTAIQRELAPDADQALL